MKNLPHHKRFLETNGLSPADLPEPLRRKLKNYDLIKSMLPDTVDQDRESLEERLQRIDVELTEDLFDEYFEENQESEVSDQVSEMVKSQPNGDELVLTRLWEQGKRTKLLRSLFIREGIETPISGTIVKIGPFVLRKTGVFRHEYSLTRNTDL